MLLFGNDILHHYNNNIILKVEIVLKKKENVMDQKNCSATHIGFLVFSYHSSSIQNFPLSNMAVITVKGPIGLS